MKKRRIWEYLIPASLLFTAIPLAVIAQNAELDSLLRANSNSKLLDTNKAKTLNLITLIYIATQPDSAMIYAKEGLALVNKLKWKKGIGVFQTSIGRILSNNGENEEALKHYRESYAIWQETKNAYNMAVSLNNIGSAYQRMSINSEALYNTIEALKMAELAKNDFMMGLCTQNIASIYFSQENYGKAKAYAFKSLEIREKNKDQSGIIGSYEILGNIYLTLKDLARAEEFYKKAVALNKKIDNPGARAISISHLALVYDQQPAKKLQYLFEAQVLFDQTSPKHPNSISNLGNIGGTYSDLLMSDSLFNKTTPSRLIPRDKQLIAANALKYINKAVAYSRETSDIDNLCYNADQLSTLLAHLGDYKNAFINLSLSQKIRDSLYSQETKNKIADLEAQYTFERKEEIYKKERQLAKLKLSQLWLYGIITVLAVCSALLYLLYRSRIKQLRLRSSLQQQLADQKARDLDDRIRLSESELKAIRSQMNPHFIFNVLNSIESYILENDARTASRLVQKFAALSRLILENSTQSVVIAQREWKALQLYTELEAMRYSNSFSYTFETDPAISLLKVYIPPMLVQPLIENAIHHGLRHDTKSDKRLSVTITQRNEKIMIIVTDNGIGINKASLYSLSPSIKETSVGLSAITDRLELINQTRTHDLASFSIRDLSEEGGTGTRATLILPLIYMNEN